MAGHRALRIAGMVAGLWCAAGLGAETRRIVSLDGTWAIAEGTLERAPERFDRREPVPGLADMAEPPFADVGVKSGRREAFWYRRSFRVDGPVPPVAILEIHKAKFGTRVLLNGTLVGDHVPCFTPGRFDVRPHLRGGGAANEILVRVGAFRDAVPASFPAGWDFEKIRYIPGIYDAVELILTGTPYVARVQTVPDLPGKAVRVHAVLRHVGPAAQGRLSCRVREVASGEVVGTGASDALRIGAGEERAIDVRIPIARCRPWSPEDPFLYELEASTGADALRVRFGMRTFRFDPASGRAILNGKPYFLRGTNVCIFRFFEDPARGDRPWRAEWVRRLHRAFRSMHWNAIRYCIGFPPEVWYRVADEEGFLIQDEFPIWHGGKWPAALRHEELEREYADWIHERANHPCVVIWDAQNESRTEETGRAIQAVRGLDLSDRPWDNGWARPQAPGDVFESHPYLFSNPAFRLAKVAGVPPVPRGNPIANEGGNPIIINEYGWLWLNRDGTPTTLSRKVYGKILGPDASVEVLRETYARYLAALTEFWRSHRKAAGVLHFCGLGYSRPGGQTSDHFTDIEALAFEPHFRAHVRDAFAPVGLMLDEWAETLPAGAARTFRVAVVNDLERAWEGTVRLRIARDGRTILEKAQPCAVPGLGRRVLSFQASVPRDPGAYRLAAILEAPGAEPVRSLRDVRVVPPEARKGTRRQ